MTPPKNRSTAKLLPLSKQQQKDLAAELAAKGETDDAADAGKPPAQPELKTAPEPVPAPKPAPKVTFDIDLHITRWPSRSLNLTLTPGDDV